MLPIFQDPNKNLMLVETNWSAVLNPVIDNPIVQGHILSNVALTTGTNTINHKLGRKLQGWIVVGRNNASTIYDNQAANPNPQLNLILTASAGVTVNLYVF